MGHIKIYAGSEVFEPKGYHINCREIPSVEIGFFADELNAIAKHAPIVKELLEAVKPFVEYTKQFYDTAAKEQMVRPDLNVWQSLFSDMRKLREIVERMESE